MMSANLAAYLFQFLMGRFLTPADFGAMNAMLSFATILGVPAVVLTLVVARRTAGWEADGASGRVKALYARMLTWWGGMNLVALAALILLSPFLVSYFRLEGAGPIFWAAGILLSGVLHPLNSGVFQGRQWMVLLGGLALLSSAVRLGIGGATAVWDLGVGGGLGASVAGNVTSVAIGGAVLWFAWRNVERGPTPLAAELWRETGGVLLATLGLALFMSADIVLVKHYFDPKEAGNYAAAAVMGKAVVYLPGAVLIALYPMAAEYAAMDRKSRSLFVQALITAGALSGAGAAGLYALSGPIIHHLYGGKYDHVSNLLGFFGLAMLPLALTQVVVSYLLAKARYTFIPWVLFWAAALCVGIALFHGDGFQVIAVVFTASALCLASLLILEGRRSRTP
jgi:O-antigen/teichoic acid export membrane protein